MMTLLFNLVLAGYIAALLFAVINLLAKRQFLDWVVHALLAAANVIQLVYIIWRWVEAVGRPSAICSNRSFCSAWATVLVYW